VEDRCNVTMVRIRRKGGPNAVPTTIPMVA
jgi:hypothetical protein